jgi:hypothetical protein
MNLFALFGIALGPCDKKHENDKSHDLTCTRMEESRYEWLKLSDAWVKNTQKKPADEPDDQTPSGKTCKEGETPYVDVRTGETGCINLDDMPSADETTAYHCGIDAVLSSIIEREEHDPACDKFELMRKALYKEFEKARDKTKEPF